MSSLCSSRKIRLGYVIDSLRRHGTQTALLYLVDGLAKREYEQRVYCLNDAADPVVETQLTRSGARVTIIGKRQLATGRGLIELYQQLRRWQPAVVQTFLPFGDLIGRPLARAAKVPVLVSSIRDRNIDKHRWQYLLDRITVRWVDRVVFNSQHVIPFSIQHEGVRTEQVVYIPNCVRVDQASEARRHAEVRLQLAIPLEAKVIGTVGRLYLQKGHSYLLSAFEKVLKAVPNALLLLIGDGPLRCQLEAEALRIGVAEQTRFLGERHDVPDLLAALDVYVQPSIHEGMPNAVMEAMAMGKPVIATDVDGIPELVSDGETGWLVEPRNSEALAEQIIYALGNTEDGTRIGAAAALRMRSQFSVSRMITAYDELYQGLLSHKRGALR